MRICFTLFVTLFAVASPGYAEIPLPTFNDDMRLANPPAMRMTCFPGSDFVVFEPVQVGAIPTNTQQQKTFLAQASRQNITIGMEKVGPFDEDKGSFQATCKTDGHITSASFTYLNYPSNLMPTGNDQYLPIMSDGGCDMQSRLDLTKLTVDGQKWGQWSNFLHYCQDAQILKLTVYPTQKRINVCTIPNGGGPGYTLERTENTPQTITCQDIKPSK